MTRFAALLAPLFAFAAAPAAAETATPAMWRVADEDTTIYLLGTIHVLPDDYVWRDARIERAVAESDELVIETLLPEDPNAPAQMIAAMGLRLGLPPLAERVEAEDVPELRALLQRGGIPEGVLDNFESWAAALMLVGVSLNAMGLTPDNGVEEALESAFGEAGKPIVGLETPVEQLEFLDALPEPAQRAFLASAIDDPEVLRAELDRMLAAWAAGDEAAIAASFDELSAVPEVREALLTRRNANWARWISERMTRPGTVLVAVGSGHLVGHDSVQVQLHAAGIESERVH